MYRRKNVAATRFALRRRDLIVLIAGALLPLSAAAQQPDRVRRVGVLMGSRENDPNEQAYAAAFVQGLDVLGWHMGSNLLIDWRWAGGEPTLFKRCARELVALGPEVIVANSSPAVAALRLGTNTIPLIFTVVSDPVGQGYVASLAHPGGNTTGFSVYDPPMAGKWLQMLTQTTPPVARVAVLYNPATAPFAPLMLSDIEKAAPSLAVTVQAAAVDTDAEIEATMTDLAREGRGGLLVLQGVFTITHRNAIAALAAKYRLPAVYPYRFITEIGGLMSYGADNVDLFRRAAAYVDRILKGEKPGDLPVQAPTKFELAINLKTAKALGLTVASVLLQQADKVIE